MHAGGIRAALFGYSAGPLWVDAASTRFIRDHRIVMVNLGRQTARMMLTRQMPMSTSKVLRSALSKFASSEGSVTAASSSSFLRLAPTVSKVASKRDSPSSALTQAQPASWNPRVAAIAKSGKGLQAEIAAVVAQYAQSARLGAPLGRARQFRDRGHQEHHPHDHCRDRTHRGCRHAQSSSSVRPS